VLVDGTERIDCTFEAFQHHAGGCLQSTNHAPVRFEATWPMPGTLKRLSQKAG
jgi:hypothetical protein